MRKLSSVVAVAACLAVAPLVAAQGAEVPSSPTAQVKSGLYVTAKEAAELMAADKGTVLVDVRDPIEIMFTGYAPVTTVHVPYQTADRTRFNADKGVFLMEKNPAFADQVEAKLAALGADKDRTKVIFMCRSGSTRSAPAADLLYARGWKHAYTMVDGFEGETRKDGPSKGVRDVDGWRNSGLPWSYKLDPKVMDSH